VTSSQPLGQPDVATFLVERYLSATASGGLVAAVERLARVCDDPVRSGSGIHYLHSVYLPTEDTCFCLFSGPSAEAVRALNDEVDFGLDRITAAVVLLPDDAAQADSDRKVDR
jgi:hypothetical protein